MINRDYFYSEYREVFGNIKQPTVDELNFLLGKFDTSSVFDTAEKIAYALATIKRETANTFAPVNEGYWITNNRVGKLYNYYKINNPGALRTIFPNGLYGPNYLGRGYVQVTHNFNALKLEKRTGKPYLKNPDLLLERKNAFESMEIGMSEGIFTGKKLSNYFAEGKCDFYNARKIINGLDAASEIARDAELFLRCIQFSIDVQAEAINGTDVEVSPGPKPADVS